MVVTLFIWCVAHVTENKQTLWVIPSCLWFSSSLSSFSALQKRPEDINRRSADMWSFSVLLWELVTREVPFADLSHMEIGMKVSGRSAYLPTGFTHPHLCISWTHQLPHLPEAFTANLYLTSRPRSSGGSRRSSANHSTGDFTSYL